MTIADYEGRFPESPIRSPRLVDSLKKGGEKQAGYKTYGGLPPDGRLKQFLVGSLLGDGSLQRTGNSPRARYSEGAGNPDYLNWKATMLRPYFPVKTWERLSRPDTRTGKRYLSYFLKTGVHPFLGDWHPLWYADRKVAPLSLVDEYLTDLAFAVWFCDHGCMQPHGACLYTMAFSSAETTALTELVRGKFGFPASVLTNAAGQPFLRFPSRVRAEIKDLLQSVGAPGMAYKYNDQP
jgi:hypothetical protein